MPIITLIEITCNQALDIEFCKTWSIYIKNYGSDEQVHFSNEFNFFYEGSFEQWNIQTVRTIIIIVEGTRAISDEIDFVRGGVFKLLGLFSTDVKNFVLKKLSGRFSKIRIKLYHFFQDSGYVSIGAWKFLF